MEIPEAEMAWLAGLMEGEGTFLMYRCHVKGREYRYPKMAVAMTDRDVIEHVARLFGNGVYDMPPDPRRPHGKPCYRTHISGWRAADLMTAMLPWLGERRTEKITAILAEYEAQEPTWARRSRACSEAAAGRPRDPGGKFI